MPADQAWHVVPKANGGTRRLVVLDPGDELAFARSVVRVAPTIGRALGRESYANRLVGWDAPRGLLLEPWRHARRRWRGEVRRLGSRGRFVAVTDVRACYGSIAPSVIDHQIRMLGAPSARVDEIGSWLRAFWEAGVEGLPVGPAASALLADAVLTVGDDAVRSTGASFVRWVDDVAIFASDRRARSGGARRPARRVGIARLGDARAEDPPPGRSARGDGIDRNDVERPLGTSALR